MAAELGSASTLATRTLFVACVVASACTVDSEDGATSLGGTTVPTATSAPTTTFGTSATMTSTTSASTTATATEATSEPEDSTGDPSSPTEDTSPSDDTSGGSGPDEQPADGVYSACESVAQCFGATACVTIGSEGYCSIACVGAGDCPASPGGTSVPACVPANISGVDMTVCALDCGGGKSCPGGMTCVALGASMVCV
jgi:hypothetical protein